MGAGLGRAPLARHVGILGFREEIADRMEQERARTAARIEHALFQRAVNGSPHHLRRQPIRCVIFAEPVPLFAIDQQFVEDLQNVAFHFGEAEAADMVHDTADQRLALGVGHHPVEEIALDRAVDPRRGEGVAREQPFWLVFAQFHDGECDAFRHDDQESVLEPQHVAFDLAPVNELQQVGP